MIVGGLVGTHLLARIIAVAARADAAADHHRRALGLEFFADVDHQFDRLAVDPGQLGGGVSERVRPIGIGPPGRAFEDEAKTTRLGYRGVADKIVAQAIQTFLRLEKIESSEHRQVEAVEIDERSLDAAVGEKQAVRQLRQAVTIFGHNDYPNSPK